MENRNNCTSKKKEICRLCLTYDGLMRSIFDSEVTEESENCLPIKISSCLSIKVSTSDKLPSKICHRCLFKVDMFFEFKIMCLNSEKTLKNSFNSTSSDVVSENAMESVNGSENTIDERISLIKGVKSNKIDEKESTGLVSIGENVSNVLVSDRLAAVVEEAEHYLESSEGITMAGAAEELKCEVSVTNFELMDVKDESSDVDSNDSENNEDDEQNASVEHSRLDENPYSCQECWKPFSHNSSLMHNECPHAIEQPFACDLCPLSFGRSSQLMRHRASKHMQHEDGPLRCPVCGRTFSDVYSQSRHMRTHSGLRPFSCMFCPRAFTRHTNLVAHIAAAHQQQQILPLDVSRGDNPANACGVMSDVTAPGNKKRRNFTCELCSKNFSDSYTLQRHGRTHTGERPYPCSICGKTFSRSWSLARHVLLHTGERPHCCPLCGKRFADRSHLLRHVRTHGRAAAAAESALRAK